jgi:hypothetical protein
MILMKNHLNQIIKCSTSPRASLIAAVQTAYIPCEAMLRVAYFVKYPQAMVSHA